MNDHYSTRHHIDSNRSKHNQNIDSFFQEKVEDCYRNTWVKENETNAKYDIEENYIENIRRWWETRSTIEHIYTCYHSEKVIISKINNIESSKLLRKIDDWERT